MKFVNAIAFSIAFASVSISALAEAVAAVAVAAVTRLQFRVPFGGSTWIR